MIDSHCHLADTGFAEDLPDVVARAKAAGVERAMCILAAGDAEESAAAVRVRELWPGIKVAVGVHPHEAGTWPGRAEESAELVRKALVKEKADALGEIGLDYHYDFSPPKIQQGVFSAQLTVAKTLGLPVVIHTREATLDTFDIIKRVGKGSIRGIFHCFSGDVAMARTALDLGFYISISGIITFPKAQEIAEVAGFVPADRLLIETDAPYLAPAPARGRRNEPAFVTRVLEVVAGLRRMGEGPLREQLVKNFDALLGPTVTQDKA